MAVPRSEVQGSICPALLWDNSSSAVTFGWEDAPFLIGNIEEPPWRRG